METSLLRASSSLLPFGRARRLGSGRLPLAVLPGHGAVVLAGRRAGTGSGGVLTVALKLKVPRPVCGVKATPADSGAPTEGGDGLEEFELVTELKAMLEGDMRWKSGFSDPDDDNPLHKNDQELIASFAGSSFTLLIDVTNRLRPPAKSKLYEGLRLCGETLIKAAVRGTKSYASWKNASDVIEALDLLRRLVSSTLEAPLPQDWWLGWHASLPIEYNDAELGLIQILRRTFDLVERDVKSMLGDSN
ncbi:unnamed protein product [Urochloa decumbens]|uniref:Uncharacterized protein n=1 Tax=Urochloa decumbens TaxID=240449 RepID=A0ABC8Z510_9POAL